MKIMLVDDEEGIRVSLGMILSEEGYDICCAENGEEALEKYEREKPDLIVLDVMMAKLNGFDVCRRIRRINGAIPILILSAKGDIVDKSVGFHAGADDYLVKPFSTIELLLRIEALLRRRENAVSQPINSTSYSVGDLEVFFNRHEVRLGGKPVDLTPKEYKILAYMASHPGKAFSREQLQEYVWGENYSGELGGIAVFVRRIREKIESDSSKPRYLLTVWGVGYKINEE